MKTHDYTARYWGHDYTITQIHNKGETINMMGWGHGLENGDFIIFPNEGKTTRYKLNKVEYLKDPPDMWRATASFAPRMEAVV